jgi:hypothetical protein
MTQYPASASIPRSIGAIVAMLAMPLVAIAQEAAEMPLNSVASMDIIERTAHAGGTGMSFRLFDVIEFSSAQPGQRPRGSLRFRFDSATRAFRSMGLEADECRTVVRSTSHRVAFSASGGTDPRRLGLGVALSCKFF